MSGHFFGGCVVLLLEVLGLDSKLKLRALNTGEVEGLRSCEWPWVRFSSRANITKTKTRANLFCASLFWCSGWQGAQPDPGGNSLLDWFVVRLSYQAFLHV